VNRKLLSNHFRVDCEGSVDAGLVQTVQG
jgi:hypothetical protein